MNGIIEIQLGGQLRTIRFNNYAKAELGNIYGLDPLEAGQKLGERMQDNYVRAIADLVYAGLTGAYYAKGHDRDFTRADVAEWVAEAADTDMAKVFTTWIDATGIRQIIKQQQQPDADTGKKKRRGPKS
jgi:hypothetical protein